MRRWAELRFPSLAMVSLFSWYGFSPMCRFTGEGAVGTLRLMGPSRWLRVIWENRSYTSTPPVGLHGVVLSLNTGTTLPYGTQHKSLKPDNVVMWLFAWLCSSSVLKSSTEEVARWCQCRSARRTKPAVEELWAAGRIRITGRNLSTCEGTLELYPMIWCKRKCFIAISWMFLQYISQGYFIDSVPWKRTVFQIVSMYWNIIRNNFHIWTVLQIITILKGATYFRPSNQ